MNIHNNARLTPHGRGLIVRQIESGQTPEAAARAAGVCPRTARKWVARFKAEGLEGLKDRSSRPHRLRQPTVDQFAGMLTLVAADRLGGFEGFNPIEPEAPENTADGGRRHPELGGNLLAGEALPAQGLDPFDHGCRGVDELPADGSRTAGLAVAGDAVADLVEASELLDVGPARQVRSSKTRDGHEIGLDVADWASVVATDAPEQIRNYGTPFFLDGWTRRDEVADLSVFAGGARKARPSGLESTLFCSAGLAGTEVLVASALLPFIAA